jgi:hypothetical protein
VHFQALLRRRCRWRLVRELCTSATFHYLSGNGANAKRSLCIAYIMLHDRTLMFEDSDFASVSEGKS